ncbi:PE domain-containing protein [Actinosynnema pretiosum]|uniref:PE domain-containing protein n=1 Tax=Actinosynnema pretiosum TaxID=42197 RepID=UPI0012FE3048|nr:PE domain-containing protein [Actinosynnema pretiosum]
MGAGDRVGGGLECSPEQVRARVREVERLLGRLSELHRSCAPETDARLPLGTSGQAVELKAVFGQRSREFRVALWVVIAELRKIRQELLACVQTYLDVEEALGHGFEAAGKRR